MIRKHLLLVLVAFTMASLSGIGAEVFKIPTKARENFSGWNALSMTPDGAFFTFGAPERSLVSESTNKNYQAFVFDTRKKSWELIPTEKPGTVIESHISNSGREVVYLLEPEGSERTILYHFDRKTKKLRKLVAGEIYNTQFSGDGRFVPFSNMSLGPLSGAAGIDLRENREFSLMLEIAGEKIRCRERMLNDRGILGCVHQLPRIGGRIHLELVLFDLRENLKPLYRLDYVKFFKWDDHGLHYPYLGYNKQINDVGDEAALLIRRQPTIGQPHGERSIYVFEENGTKPRSLVDVPITVDSKFWQLEFVMNKNFSALMYLAYGEENSSLYFRDNKTGSSKLIGRAPNDEQRLGFLRDMAISNDSKVLVYYSDYDPKKPEDKKFNLYVYYQ